MIYLALAVIENSNSNPGMVIPFCLELNGHFISARMESSFHSGWNRMESFNSIQNGMSSPFQPDWKDYSIPSGLEMKKTEKL